MDAVALRSFEAGHASHLGVTAGDIVVVVDDGRLQKAAHWLRCSRDGKEGFVPRNHLVVRKVDVLEAAAAFPGSVEFGFAPEPGNEAFLPVAVGDQILVLRDETGLEGWVECSLQGRRGLVPRNRVSFTPRPTSPYQSLADLLVGDSQSRLLMALGNIIKPTAADKMARHLLELYVSNEQELRMLKACIESEVEATTSKGTFFRRNSINSSALAAFSRARGAEYVCAVLGSTVAAVAADSPSAYEIDPSRIESGLQLPANLARLSLRCQELLDRLVATAHLLPRPLAHVAAVLAESVPSADRHAAVGGFLLLRFLCPLIASSPDIPGMPVVPSDRRRGLVLISKIMINLANNVEFGKKEAYMAPFESILQSEGTRKLGQYFDLVATVALAETLRFFSARPPSHGPAFAEEYSLSEIHMFLMQQNIAAEMRDQNPELSERLRGAIRDGRRQVASQCRQLISLPCSQVDADTFGKLTEQLGHALERDAHLERLESVTADAKERKKILHEQIEVFTEIRGVRHMLLEWQAGTK